MRAALAAASGLAVLPVLGSGIVDWDPTRSFRANPRYRGLGWAQPRGVATEAHYDAPGVARSFAEPARHGPERPVPRLGLARARLARGEPGRARAELDVLRRLRPDLATILAARRAS
jgi:hypothetical protein